MTATFTPAEIRELGFEIRDGRCVRVRDVPGQGIGIRPPKTDATHSAPSAPDQERPQFKSKAEALYADRLTAMQRAGEIRRWRYEVITLKLGDDVRLTIDFLVELWDDPVMELHEVKGKHTWDDAKAKLRIAATEYPGFRILLVKVIGGRVDSITPIRALAGAHT